VPYEPTALEDVSTPHTLENAPSTAASGPAAEDDSTTLAISDRERPRQRSRPQIDTPASIVSQ